MCRKVESSNTEAEIVRIGVKTNWSGKEEKFFKQTGKGDKWATPLCVGGENRAADLNFSKKMASQSRSFETALSSLDAVCRKLHATYTSKPNKNNEIGQIDDRNQKR